MTNNHAKYHPDTVIIYQDLESVKDTIKQVQALDIALKTLPFSIEKMSALTHLKPRLLLISSNNIKSSIKLYIDFLAKYQGKIAEHSAVLLINNKESTIAYTACENGLFDDYIVISPLVEPTRIKLVIHQIFNANRTAKGITQLVKEGENELANLISCGYQLKQNFLTEVKKCERSILTGTAINIENLTPDKEALLQEFITTSFKKLNHTILEQLNASINQSTKVEDIQKAISTLLLTHKPNASVDLIKTEPDISTNGESLNKEDKNKAEQKVKLLVAEPSELFANVIQEIFDDTEFTYKLSTDGNHLLYQLYHYKPDIILLAFDLPVLNGIQVTKRIRSIGNNLPIVAFTHSKDKNIIKQWIKLGISGYLTKPSSKSNILKAVRKAIANPSGVIALPRHNNINNKIEWIPSYSVGNNQLDEQHKNLFELINDFFEVEDKENALAVFAELKNTVIIHFKTEERYLEHINYPNKTAHIAIHNTMLKKFNLLHKKLQRYDIEIQHKIAMFLYNWLAKHILKEDMDYKQHSHHDKNASTNDKKSFFV